MVQSPAPFAGLFKTIGVYMTLPKHFAIVLAGRPDISDVEQRQAHSALGNRLRESGFSPQTMANCGAAVKKQINSDLTYGFIVPLTEDEFNPQIRALWPVAQEFLQVAIQVVTAGSVGVVVNLTGETMSLIPMGRWSEVSDVFALTKDIYTVVPDSDTNTNRYYVTEFNLDISPPKSAMH